MTTDIKQNLKTRTTWLRGLYILVFAVIYSIAEIVVAAVVLFQFLSTLFTATKNQRLLDFGNNLTSFIYQVLQYLTFNSDNKPFPFDEWPGSSEGRSKEHHAEPGTDHSDDPSGKIIGHT